MSPILKFLGKQGILSKKKKDKKIQKWSKVSSNFPRVRQLAANFPWYQTLKNGNLMDNCGQLWFLCVSLSWRAFGGQVQIGADNSGSLVSL